MTITSEDVGMGRFHRPAEDDDLPGLILVHDVWGLSEHSAALATDWAREGFGVLEIDLYRRLDRVEIGDVGAWIRGLSDPEVVADLEDGARWLAEESAACRGRRVGITGVCMGGLYTLLAACRSGCFAAAAPFYGMLSYDEGMLAADDGRDHVRKPVSPIEASEALRCPTIASFGREDGFVPETDVDALEAGFARSGTRFEIDRYAGAGHAFLNRTRPEAYSEAASEAAWSRVVPFMRDALGGRAPR